MRCSQWTITTHERQRNRMVARIEGPAPTLFTLRNNQWHALSFESEYLESVDTTTYVRHAAPPPDSLEAFIRAKALRAFPYVLIPNGRL